MAEPSRSELRPSAERESVKIVYTMGAARSGSTILGVTLGNCDGFFYAGELRGWLEKSGTPRLDGEQRIRFWALVNDEVKAPRELAGSAPHDIERSISLLRPRSWWRRRRLRSRYRDTARELFGAIARVANARYVIDTSSYPLRARELKKVDGLDVYLLYVVRDPHSVIASFTGREWKFRESTLLTNLYLSITTLLSTLVFLAHPRERRLLVRHEDFIADPARVLRQVLDRVESPATLPDLGSLKTGVAFGGNRLLRSGETIALRGAPERSPRRSPVTALLQLPWAPVLRLLRPAVRGPHADAQASPELRAREASGPG
jgi:hypothetical protein